MHANLIKLKNFLFLIEILAVFLFSSRFWFPISDQATIKIQILAMRGDVRSREKVYDGDDINTDPIVNTTYGTY
jgi:hypothetical protein